MGRLVDRSQANDLWKSVHFAVRQSRSSSCETQRQSWLELLTELGILLTFVTYLFIPLSVGMFPHLFHWLTAKRAFRLTVIAHPRIMMCGAMRANRWWASEILPPAIPPAAVLSNMLLHQQLILTDLLTAGVLAIMSSLDSQFLCLGTILPTISFFTGSARKNIPTSR